MYGRDGTPKRAEGTMPTFSGVNFAPIRQTIGLVPLKSPTEQVYFLRVKIDRTTEPCHGAPDRVGKPSSFRKKLFKNIKFCLLKALRSKKKFQAVKFFLFARLL